MHSRDVVEESKLLLSIEIEEVAEGRVSISIAEPALFADFLL
jgi:hypothetical protein